MQEADRLIIRASVGVERAPLMSLNRNQSEATRAELHSNTELSGLSADAIANALGMSLERVQSALGVSGAAPQDVWLVRDFLDRTIRRAGGTPYPYTSLTESARAAAQGWFGLRDVEAVLGEQQH